MPDAILFDLIDVHLLAAGFLGGMVHAFNVRKATPWQFIGYILVGGIAANFIAPQMLKILALVPSGFVAFGIGMSGKHLCLILERTFDNLLGKIKNE